MAKDLRTFLAYLEEHMPESLLYVDREIDPRFEASGVLSNLEREGRYPAVVFRKIKGSSFPVVSNMHADPERLYAAMGLRGADLRSVIVEYGRREASPIEPLLIQDGPVKEVRVSGEEVNLMSLPAFTYHEKDAGPYITLGMCVMKDPDTGIRNAGIYRLMVKDHRRLGIQISETSHGHYIRQKNEDAGKPTEVAVVIGHHPGFYLGCLSLTGLDVDEFAVAGGILEEPLEIVRCDTIDLEVPANAEIVLEGLILPHVREDEAPFGEFGGTYSKRKKNPVVEIRAITHRRDAYYQDSFAGHADNLVPGGLTRSSFLLKTISVAVPTVKEVHMPRCGRCRFICYISLKKMVEGDPKIAAMAAFGADPYLKYVIVVDEDVNVTSDEEMLHAIATRMRAQRDMFMIPYAKGSPLDPSAYRGEGDTPMVDKVGFDATRKPGYPDEISVPGAENIDLSKYLICRSETKA